MNGDSKRFDFTDIGTLTESLIKESKYFAGEEPALDATFYKQKRSKLLVMTGENAQGKSFMTRLYGIAIKKYGGFECICTSQERRTESGIMRAIMFGDESCESTGDISSRVVKTGIKTCKARESRHAIIYDEPDLGLSDSYSCSIGVTLREFIEHLPEKTFSVIVISHSRYLIQELLPLNPHHLRFGEPMTLKQWVRRKVEPLDLDALHSRALKTFGKISTILKE